MISEWQQVLSNGFVVLIPILVWNAVFTSRLPAAFRPASFNQGVPPYITAGENVSRAAVFLMPLVLRLDISTPVGMTGIVIFALGVLLYFLSWLGLIYAAASRWSTSVFGFCAPAYTPFIWLVGLSLMADSYYFNASYSRWHFILPSACFSLFHLLHTVHVFRRMGKA